MFNSGSGVIWLWFSLAMFDFGSGVFLLCWSLTLVLSDCVVVLLWCIMAILGSGSGQLNCNIIVLELILDTCLNRFVVKSC